MQKEEEKEAQEKVHQLEIDVLKKKNGTQKQAAELFGFGHDSQVLERFPKITEGVVKIEVKLRAQQG